MSKSYILIHVHPGNLYTNHIQTWLQQWIGGPLEQLLCSEWQWAVIHDPLRERLQETLRTHSHLKYVVIAFSLDKYTDNDEDLLEIPPQLQTIFTKEVHNVKWAAILMVPNAVPDGIYFALQHGFNDIIRFPCSVEEWEARIGRAFSTELKQKMNQVIAIGELSIDMERKRVIRGEQPVSLTPKEYELLLYMALRTNRICSREELLREIWHMAFDAQTNIVEVYIRYLRRKIDRGHGWKFIRTVRGHGYRLESPIAET
ncbi:winged helix-turn-helix domain-containing protein [Paenibacillus apiarius]|uniref:Response regulator transcription factor n=1 Tax=Paenibacillus apiarius TaxID=46240 RepID=A0ABT4DUC5_9BACL|nr:response regulator transcription factor [Paenibacillus apiarius]MCY9515940.1 response regulator transcription factor [Paenibacillus apiarius]MCY9520850.1 response regulator transcription factor [Paenibacillus apiarius]MCY9553555.1 response regulator transcription factor [Paenibacillus apiarius]MCY9557922.1 response regulator transcription factor [Paenibacillus apiarius]MCY9685777.1 response regulator transcription factor [Paenibacillus apiarius]